MHCDAAREALSERMDGERLAPRREARLERHLSGCARCRGFAERAWRVRESVRFEVTPPVPDLVDAIMARVAEEAGARRGGRGLLRLPGRDRWAARLPGGEGMRRRPGPVRRELARLAVALLAGAVGGVAVAGSGLWPGGEPPGVPTASAAEVSRGVLQAAGALSAYHATYAVREAHFRPSRPVREFTVDVWFAEPDRFRLSVVDRTVYPKPFWPPNDMTLIVNGPGWYSEVPPTCPADAFPSCPVPANEVRVQDSRGPVAGPAPILTDAVLPVNTLADANRLTALGPGTVAGRPAVRVSLAHRDAAPLFAFLQQGGTWRPFHPEDRVVLWLDPETWFPLRYRVFPAPGAERRLWAFRFGLPEEPPGRSVLSVTAVSLDLRVPEPSVFALPGEPERASADEALSLEDAVRTLGRSPLLPGHTAGLDLYRVDVPDAQSGLAGRVQLTFAQGLTWLELHETWAGQGPPVPVGPEAERVELPGGGVAYYEPATDRAGRRLAIHAAGVDLYLETNLPRADLLRIAASLPVLGEDLPAFVLVTGEGSTERVPLEEALAEVPFPVSLPVDLPAGYRAVSAELVLIGDAMGLNVYFQGLETGTEEGIQLHLELAGELPPASGAEQFTVEVRGVQGRWIPDRATLEWVEEGVYHSLAAPGLDLDEVLAMAESLVSVEDLASPAEETEAQT